MKVSYTAMILISLIALGSIKVILELAKETTNSYYAGLINGSAWMLGIIFLVAIIIFIRKNRSRNN